MYVPLDILKIVASYVIKPNMKLLDWINKDKIKWRYLSENPNAIYLLEQNKNKINWWDLFGNPNIFEIDKIQIKINITKNAKFINKLIYQHNIL